MERKPYEVIVEDGKFFYKQSGLILDTNVDIDSKWIFVLSTTKSLYVGKKRKGTFQHSSFLAGGATTAAGRLVVESGILKVIFFFLLFYLDFVFLELIVFNYQDSVLRWFFFFPAFQQAVWPHSGHYRPTEQNFNDFISFLKENNVDLTDVKVKI